MILKKDHKIDLVEISVNNLLKLVLIFFFISNCSLHKNSKFWSNQDIIKEKKKNVSEIIRKKEKLTDEFNPNLKISLYSKTISKSFINNFDNNNGRVAYNGELKNLSKYKFSKIKNFHQYDPKILFYKEDIIFFDNSGSILRGSTPISFAMAQIIAWVAADRNSITFEMKLCSKPYFLPKSTWVVPLGWISVSQRLFIATAMRASCGVSFTLLIILITSNPD